MNFEWKLNHSFPFSDEDHGRARAGKDANYIRTQLNKRIDAKNLRVKVSVVNNITYLEK